MTHLASDMECIQIELEQVESLLAITITELFGGEGELSAYARQYDAVITAALRLTREQIERLERVGKALYEQGRKEKSA